MVKANGIRLKEMSMLVNGSMDNFMEKEHIFPVMETSMLVNSRMEKEMVKADGIRLKEMSM